MIRTSTEAEWLEARRKGVTASEVAGLMGLSPDTWDSPYSLYHRKTGTLPPGQPDSESMERGRVLEPYVLQKFGERHPEFIVDGAGKRMLFAHRERPWQMATPDGLLQDDATCGIAEINGVFEIENLGVLEAKTSATYDEWGDDGTDEIPVHYRCQVLWQMDALGVPLGYVACLFMHTWKVRVYRIELDDRARADLKLMREEALGFLASIAAGEPPEVDWRPATSSALRELHPEVEDRDAPVTSQLAAWYLAACRRADTEKRKKALYGNRILAAIGNARCAVDPGRGGMRVATRSASNPRRLDGDMLRQLYPEAAAACTRASEKTVISLTAAKPPKPKAITP
jgi:putative phage-type endonuclease